MMFQAFRRLLLPTCILSVLVLLAACDTNDMAPDTTVGFVESSYQVSESSQSLDVEVELSQSAPESATIPLAIGGSAIAGEDYKEPEANEVTIEQGSSTGTFTI